MRTKNVVVEKWNPKWKDEFERIVDSLGEDIIYIPLKLNMLEAHLSKACLQNQLLTLILLLKMTNLKL